MRESTVLVVDDSTTVRKVVEHTLQRENIRVRGAPDGLTALAEVIDTNPDLILLDIMLAHLDGYQVCQIIRKNPDFKRVPIVMLSGKDGVFDKLKGRLAGSTGYITKPFDPKQLVKAVNKYLDGK